jgi:hypothetical protein
MAIPKPVPMPEMRKRRAAKAMPMTGPKKKSSGATAPLKAQKPKKATTSQKTRALMNRAYDLRTIEKVGATSADKAKRNRQSLDASRTAARAVGIANREDKKKAAAKKASYSPEYMSNRAKSDMNDRAMKKQLSKYGMSKTEYGYKLNVGKSNRRGK